MKRFLAALSIAALTGGALAACGAEAPESTCAPRAASSYHVNLQNIEHPFPEAPGGSSGGSGSGGGRGGSSGGGSYGGSKSGGGSYGGSKSGSSSGGSKSSGGSFSGGGGYTPRIPASKPDRGYRPAPGQPPVTYVQQPDGQWGGFLNGMLVGQMLNDPPAGCR